MTPTESIALMNPVAAWVAGLVASLHCVGMCGPLGCAVLQDGNANGRARGIASYQLGRVVSYAALGLLSGALGGRLIAMVGGLPTQVLPLAFALVIVFALAGLDRRFARFAWVEELSRRAMRRALKTPQAIRGLALGLTTPLLPCGFLYSMIWVAALTGSAGQGALVMACFALGSAPALAGALLGWERLAVRLSPQSLGRVQKGIALLAAGVLVARGFFEFDATAFANGEGFCFTLR